MSSIEIFATVFGNTLVGITKLLRRIDVCPDIVFLVWCVVDECFPVNRFYIEIFDTAPFILHIIMIHESVLTGWNHSPQIRISNIASNFQPKAHVMCNLDSSFTKIDGRLNEILPLHRTETLVKLPAAFHFARCPN